MISRAALENRRRLGRDFNENDLSSRANKRFSTKRFIPEERFMHKENIAAVQKFIESVSLSDDIHNIISAVCALLIDRCAPKNCYALRFRKELASYDSIATEFVPQNEDDIAGIIYQSLINEGEKNIRGAYYTPDCIADTMLKNIDRCGKTLLDPCCGSGIFLCRANYDDPSLLYGYDTDGTAVMIAKTNLYIKYPDTEFEPNIYAADFLTLGTEKKFDYIITNPPWGAFTDEKYRRAFPNITSGESFSYFAVKAASILSENGCAKFLLPSSFLNIRIHSDIRRFLYSECGITDITDCGKCFSGVTTGCCIVSFSNNSASSGTTTMIGDRIVTDFSNTDKTIFKKYSDMACLSFGNSVFALGIVTGKNRELLSDIPGDGREPVYTGRQIFEYAIADAVKYIRYDRQSFQQAAPDSIYRAKEKLVYRFISNKLVFACDRKGRLFLNSANIIIPDIDGLSANAVMCFLNSSLYRYIYRKSFSDIKILKGNLKALRFPKTESSVEKKLSALALDPTAENIRTIDNIVNEIFGLSEAEVKYIAAVLGK